MQQQRCRPVVVSFAGIERGQESVHEPIDETFIERLTRDKRAVEQRPDKLIGFHVDIEVDGQLSTFDAAIAPALRINVLAAEPLAESGIEVPITDQRAKRCARVGFAQKCREQTQVRSQVPLDIAMVTIYLAAAVRDNGAGEVITIEISPDKITAA